MNSLQGRSLVCVAFLNEQLACIHVVVVLCIRNRRLQQLLDNAGSVSGVVGKDTQCGLNILSSDGI